MLLHVKVPGSHLSLPLERSPYWPLARLLLAFPVQDLHPVSSGGCDEPGPVLGSACEAPPCAAPQPPAAPGGSLSPGLLTGLRNHLGQNQHKAQYLGQSVAMQILCSLQATS